MTQEPITRRYIDALAGVLQRTRVTARNDAALSLDEGIHWMRQAAAETHARGNKIMFIGNGGSAAIASHMANDYSKNGGLRATAFNDSSALTCLGNDFGYEYVFAKQIELHGNPNDLLIAISSSGVSSNILNAVTAARARNIRAVTFSGFKADNPLRASGDLNFYVPASEYGFVEMAHQALLHALLDLKIGWRPAA